MGKITQWGGDVGHGAVVMGGAGGGQEAGSVVVGISADYHDAAACVIVDGELVVAAEEERFSRRKHDPDLPVHALAWVLDAAGVEPGRLGAVAFYAKPMSVYERILSTHAAVGPLGFGVLATALRTWVGRKLWVSGRIERALRDLGHPMPKLYFAEHHQSHAASAFYPSPFERAAVLVVDGVGEWTSTSIGRGDGHRLELLAEQRFPDSLGLFYSAMTAQCGFAVNDGEYQLMGLAPYGRPTYVDRLREHVIRVQPDGSVELDQRYFGYRAGRRMGSRRLDRLLDGPPRAGREVGTREADLARSAQVILEEAMLSLARHAHELTGERRLCLAGGVALNCVANGRILREGPFDEVWIQPAAGDSGGAPGAAWWAWHHVMEEPRTVRFTDAMSGAALGPSFSDDEIVSFLEANSVPFEHAPDRAELDRRIAADLAEGRIVGWFAGRMEFGPRALGHRSILADPRDAANVRRLNGLVKERDGFRPFAPAVLADRAGEWFDLTAESPYMLFTADVAEAHRRADDGASAGELTATEAEEPDAFAARLGAIRSDVPAVTHVDGSARVQTVDADRHPELHSLLSAFDRSTGCPVLLNTSFNAGGEPIVRTPADALRTFAVTGLDVLVLERCVVRRDDLAFVGAAGGAT